MKNGIYLGTLLFFVSCSSDDGEDSINTNEIESDTIALIDSSLIQEDYDYSHCPTAWSLEDALAAPDSFCTVSLYGKEKKLTSVPADLEQISHLRSLDLSNNKINKIPDFLSELTKLSLYGNQLTACPSGLENLTQLTNLDLGRNQIKSLDPAIFKLTDLEKLNLSGNQLTDLPDELFDLISLNEFRFSENPLEEFPVQISKLVNLESLNLSSMEVGDETMPSSMANLKCLKSIYLGPIYVNSFSGEGNELTKIPDWMFELDSLQSLDLSYGMITEISDDIKKIQSLEILNLEGNLLTKLPESIKTLANLKEIYLGGNDFSDEEIERIKSWFNEETLVEFEEMNVGC